MPDEQDRETIAEAIDESYEHPPYDRQVVEQSPPGDKPANALPVITLTDEQQEAVTRIKTWLLGDEQEYRLGGYAGTGKTTVIRFIRDSLRETHCVIVVAFTGKAVNVLIRKGIRAATIHSTIYHCETINRVLHWYKKEHLDPTPDLIVVDEASMLSTELYRDLKSYGTKLLFVGDPGQLEPVGDNPNLMAHADYVLSKIHRQAEKSPIISLANSIRTGGSYPSYCSGDELIVRTKGAFDITGVDQLICAKNKTRREVNDNLRRLLRYAPHPIVENEKLMVTKNNRDLGVFNGMLLFVTKIVKDNSDHWLLNTKDEVGRTYDALAVWKRPYEDEQFETDKNPVIPRVKNEAGANVQLVQSTYGYCITCHKSQGSEWDTVLVLDEWMPPKVWDMRRWRYTAMTRAAKKLVYCVDRW